jgi:hypothetical protein
MERRFALRSWGFLQLQKSPSKEKKEGQKSAPKGKINYSAVFFE